MPVFFEISRGGGRDATNSRGAGQHAMMRKGRVLCRYHVMRNSYM
jgi:hypothetical protein